MLERPKMKRTKCYVCENWLMEFVFGILIGNMRLKAAADPRVRRWTLKEWLQHFCLSRPHAGSQFWGGVVMLMLGLMTYRDGVRKQNQSYMNTGKRYSAICHAATGDTSHLQATLAV